MSPNLYKPKVYTASRLKYYKLWRTLHADPDWAFVDFTASWPAIAEQETEQQPGPDLFREVWLRDVAEVRQSDFVLVYAGGDVALRNAMVEVGVGLAYNLQILTVGLDCEQFTWGHHPAVRCFPNLVEARMYLYRFTTMIPPNQRPKGRPYTFKKEDSDADES